MSEMHQSRVGGNGELVGCSATQAGAAADLKVDASAGTSRNDKFMSPRTAILEAKSSAEELNVSRSRVTKSRQLFETLLKEQKLPSENSPRQSQSKSRQSLPASASASAARFPRTVAKPRSSLGSGNDIVLARARAAIDGRTKSREVAKERLRADMASMGVGSGEDSSVSLATSSLKENESGDADAGADRSVEESKTIRSKGTSDRGRPSTRDARSPNRNSKGGEARDMPLKSTAPTKQSFGDEPPIAKRGTRAAQESKDIRAKARERLNATMALLNASETLESDVPAVASSSNEETSMDRKRTADADQKEGKTSVLSVEQSEMIALAKLRQKGDSRTVANAEQAQTEQEQAEPSTEAANVLSKIRQKAEVMRRLGEDRAPAETPGQGERLTEEGFVVEEAKEETLDEEEADVFAALEEHLEQENALTVQRPSSEEADAHRRKKVEHIASAALEMLDLEQTSEDLMDVVGMMGIQSPTVDAAEPELNFEAIQSCGTDSPALADRPSEASDATSLGELDSILFQGAMMVPKQAKERLWSDTKETGDAVSASFDDTASIQVAVSEESGGGRLWQAAKEEAELTTALAADFLPRGSSRGGGDERQPLSPSSNEHAMASSSNQSLHDEPSHSTYDGGYYSQSWIEEPVERKGDEVEDEVGVGSEWRGFKRNRMTAMVILGLLGGLLPSLYVIMSCHFITGNVAVGEDGVEFALHYGLQKFTPIDQAFQYYYGECQAYDSAYSNNPPTLPFALSVAAIIFAAIPLTVVAVYLHSSMTHQLLWTGSMWLFYVSFICQISTLSIFLTDLCGNGVQCSMGPGSRAAVLSSVVWFILSLEMKLNTPFVPAAESEGVVVIEKDDRIVSGAKKLWRRAKGEDVVPSLSRAAMQKQRGRIGETEIASYRPPDIV